MGKIRFLLEDYLKEKKLSIDRETINFIEDFIFWLSDEKEIIDLSSDEDWFS